MNFRRDIIKKCVAQMCINLGWESITSSALDTLTNVLESYFFSMAHSVHVASELNGPPEPSFHDLCLSFEKFDINLSDLSEYILQGDHSPLPHSVPYFPAPRYKTNLNNEQKVSSIKDGPTVVEKKQGTDCLTPIKNVKVLPEEAESSQYEMKSFSLVSLENGDLFPQVKGLIPCAKICKPLPAEETPKFTKHSSKNIPSNKSFSDVCKEKSETVPIKFPRQTSNTSEDNVKKLTSGKKETPKISFISPKKHRKPTIKEAFIAKKKQSGNSIVKVDSISDVSVEVKKKRPGRKPKKIPKSKVHVVDDEELNNTKPRTEGVSATVEKGCNSLLEVVGHSLGVEGNDAMLDDDLELGAVNDEMLVEIADQGGDSPLPNLPGIVDIQNKELFNNTEIFSNSCTTKENDNFSSNAEIEEEILPWSDEEKLKDDRSNDHKATGLELILRGQGENTSANSSLFKSPEKPEVDINVTYEKDKKKFKKLKKLKKSQKPEKIQKIKKNKSEYKEKPEDVFRKIIIHKEEKSLEPLKMHAQPNDKCMLHNANKSNEMIENDCNKAARHLSENSDYNSELDMLQNGVKLPIQPKADILEHVKANAPEFTEVLHKKKKKKGKRKMEDEASCTPKSKKFKKENSEMPVIPKLTLKFGGATVCGGDTSSPNISKDHADHASKQPMPAPIKLVIKPFTNTHPNRHGVSPTRPVQPSPNISPMPRRSISPDRLSIPSVAMSSRSPSPNDMARLASGPSNRKNMSPIYSESPSPPHEGQTIAKVQHPKRLLCPEIKTKAKEAKSTSVKSSPISKSSASKSSKSVVISETVGKITKANGEIIWICPTCGCPDSGTPMIGCDRCDDWYHWVCVNIVKEPPAEMNWYCIRCLNQNPTLKGQGPSKRGRPAGKGKSKR